jgi:hypothetical protein
VAYNTGFVTRVTRRVAYKDQEVVTFPLGVFWSVLKRIIRLPGEIMCFELTAEKIKIRYEGNIIIENDYYLPLLPGHLGSLPVFSGGSCRSIFSFLCSILL